ncbi:MAG: hypothetical protein PSX80_04370 [bacterium]|nr:hypothetical protein [bacterium]
MGSLSPLRKNTEDQPVNIGDRAIDNVKYIRDMMERSASFTAVPGYGGMLMGTTAVVAAYIASQQPSLRNWLIVWLTEAFLAAAIGFLAMWQKSKIAGGSLTSAAARKFAVGFVAPLLAGVAITLGLWRYDMYEVMAPIWMLCYGAAVITGGAFSVRVIPVMGWFFMAFGAAAFALPAAYSNYLMLASFGLTHIVFGAVIAKKYGG